MLHHFARSRGTKLSEHPFNAIIFNYNEQFLEMVLTSQQEAETYKFSVQEECVHLVENILLFIIYVTYRFHGLDYHSVF